ncbi:hypothetical protein IWQ61_004631 [Dispira simplex]|nr:hypothetical protein IWQ61_004631 [Dispira simplex]
MYTPQDLTLAVTNSPIGKTDSQKLTTFLSHIYPLPLDEPAEPWVPRDLISLNELMKGYNNYAYPELHERVNASLRGPFGDTLGNKFSSDFLDLKSVKYTLEVVQKVCETRGQSTQPPTQDNQVDHLVAQTLGRVDPLADENQDLLGLRTLLRTHLQRRAFSSVMGLVYKTNVTANLDIKFIW